MEKNLDKFVVSGAILLALLTGTYATGLVKNARAEELSAESTGAVESEKEKPDGENGMNISITPVSKILQIEGGAKYEDSFKVTNSGKEELEFEAYAAPYSFIYSEETDSYSLGFNHENSYTQITRWVTFKDNEGNWVKNPRFTVGASETKTIEYRITTPSDIPDGGQYAVLFAHTLSKDNNEGGIKTEASPGLVVYGRSTGNANISSEIRDLLIKQTIQKTEIEEDNEGNQKTVVKDLGHINASAKVKNTGNIDFNAIGKLTISGLFGGTVYETPANRGRTSIIPETELTVSDEWEETPPFGIFKVTWEVTAGENTETITSIIAINIAPLIIFVIIVLTIMIVGFIMGVKKRKERRSRFAV